MPQLRPDVASRSMSGTKRSDRTTAVRMVPRGLEPRTLRLLAVRSNQLSYETGVTRASAVDFPGLVRAQLVGNRLPERTANVRGTWVARKCVANECCHRAARRRTTANYDEQKTATQSCAPRARAIAKPTRRKRTRPRSARKLYVEHLLRPTRSVPPALHNSRPSSDARPPTKPV